MGTALKVIVIIGRPNVGKSLLFNRLIGRRQALVHSAPGMTLDFLQERLTFDSGDSVWLTDTGGVAGEEDDWTPLARQQMERAGDIADGFLFVVDAKTGCMPGDRELAEMLRRRWDVPWLLVVNKAENLSVELASADFHTLGATAATIQAISAKNGNGLAALRQAIQKKLPVGRTAEAEPITDRPPAITIVGRPNVGKSTFVNRLLKDKRMLVSERPGTTRDAVTSELQHSEGTLLLIDTAGMKRRRASLEREKMSVSAARNALAHSDAVVLIFDLSVGATHQDRRIAGMVNIVGCPLVVVGNKADLLSPEERVGKLKAEVAALLPGVGGKANSFAMSALTQKSLPVARLLAAIRKGLTTSKQHIPTGQLNQMLAKILMRRAPNRAGMIRPKLRYAHQGGTEPLLIVLHGSAVDRIDETYKRYLASAFARELNIGNTPIKIVLRAEENPYV